jgi:hypothetical protein
MFPHKYKEVMNSKSHPLIWEELVIRLRFNVKISLNVPIINRCKSLDLMTSLKKKIKNIFRKIPLT